MSSTRGVWTGVTFWSAECMLDSWSKLAAAQGRALAIAEQAWLAEGSEEALARICELQSLLNRGDGMETSSDGVMEGEGNRWSA